MQTCSVFSPAKVNLFLAITGRRPDGFHDLVSVAAQLELGDTLRLEPAAGQGDSLTCEMPGVPADATNLVLRAAQAWRSAGGEAPPVRFVLEKRVPPQSGLGGGSSNAVAALRGLERVASRPLSAAALPALAAGLGSDCALFLHSGPVVMRGRGERVEPLPEAAAARLREGEMLLCRPTTGVETAWAYRQLAKGAASPGSVTASCGSGSMPDMGDHRVGDKPRPTNEGQKGEAKAMHRPGSYLAAAEAEARVAAWIAGGGANDALSFNSFEPVVFGKFVAFPVLARRLAERHGLALRLSGSGSACFAWLRPETDWPALVADMRDALGEGCLIERTRLGDATTPKR